MPDRLLRRETTYYFRAKYPADLRHLFRSGDRWKSLKTTDLARARLLVRAESVRFDAEMEDLRRRDRAAAEATLSKAEVDRIAATYFHELMAEDEEHRSERLSDREFSSKDEAVAIVSPAARRDAARGNVEPYRDEFDDWLDSNGYKLDREAPIYREVLNRMLREFVRHMDALERRQNGDPIDTPAPPPLKAAGPTLCELVDAYLSDPAANRNSKTLLSYRVVFDALKEIVGASKPAAEVTRQDCERVRDTLLRLPSNARKKFPNVSLLAAVELGAAEGAATLGPGTVNNYLNNLAALFNWGVETWRIERNPAKGLSVHDPVAARDKRQAVPITVLPALFNAPLYTGCQNDEAGYAIPGPAQPRRGRFWVPLLSLFHGLRLGEACQLHAADVQEIEGVPVILLSDEQASDMDAADRKRIKTEAGRRYVPLHPELGRIGFLNFVADARRTGRTRLFPELSKDAHGYFSGFSKWFARFLEKAGAKTSRITFHSFRHSYRDALRRAKAPRDVVQALGGWASQGTDDDYGSGLEPAFLAEFVAQVRFDGLDLTHLHKPAAA
ncbi:site-specific integrase [Methylobacterium brachythecii]|uniref:Integrase n=1 Tax=Methylobacterium brachythecii TaxID=1176177 RepID=A0A7W6F6U5_9HYPH|nr:site-specific integrase [Methylobacterium brachythecii]MBB3902812.1 integrase [Methylobacterium brachythecii]GLS43737.1 integrase [Methylobacterium brachythecii]